MTEGSCANCEAALNPGDLYCGNCGAPATAVASAFEPAAGSSAAASSAADDGPATTPNPIAVAQMPTEPPPVGYLPDGRTRRTRGRLAIGIVTVAAVAAIAFLGVSLISTRSDLDSSRARVAQLTVAADTAPTTTMVTADDAEVAALQAQLNQINSALTQAKADLDAERTGRDEDAATASSVAAQAAADAATAAAAVATAADAAATQAQQLAQLQALFPLTSDAIAAADPTGAYTVTLTPSSCTLTDCTALTAMTLSFTDPKTVAGDRASGTAVTAAGVLTVDGPVPTALAPLCAGAAAASTFALALHVTSVQAVDGVLQAAGLAGTYTETIASGTCAAQLRAYSVVLARQ
ncbi:MAG: hypothetical protein JWN99_1986 [Ilumatobacteraceae bacterium]|nr:hypothetical protein [Ilumatobacteraceae bacterium]